MSDPGSRPEGGGFRARVPARGAASRPAGGEQVESGRRRGGGKGCGRRRGRLRSPAGNQLRSGSGAGRTSGSPLAHRSPAPGPLHGKSSLPARSHAPRPAPRERPAVRGGANRAPSLQTNYQPGPEGPRRAQSLDSHISESRKLAQGSKSAALWEGHPAVVTPGCKLTPRSPRPCTLPFSSQLTE